MTLLTELSFLIIVIVVVTFLHFCGNDYICSTDVVDVGFHGSFLIDIMLSFIVQQESKMFCLCNFVKCF